MVTSLLCVSKRSLPDHGPDAQLAELVANSGARSRLLGITGALVATSDYFAQIIEVSNAHSDETMRQVHQDPWHADVLMIDAEEIVRRSFADWAMVYAGPSTYVTRAITPFFTARSDLRARGAVQELRRMIWEFSQTDGK